MNASETFMLVCSMQVPGVDSMDLLRQMYARRPDIPVVVLAGGPSVLSAVAAIRQGAFDYVTKPFQLSSESWRTAADRRIRFAPRLADAIRESPCERAHAAKVSG